MTWRRTAAVPLYLFPIHLWHLSVYSCNRKTKDGNGTGRYEYGNGEEGNIGGKIKENGTDEYPDCAQRYTGGAKYCETCSRIDPENEHLIQEAISELTHGKTIITIAHRLATIENADRILAVDEGRIVQKGTHRELIRQEGKYLDFVRDREQAEGWQIQQTERELFKQQKFLEEQKK